MRVLSGQDNIRFAAWSRTLATPQTDGLVVLRDLITAFYNQREFLNHVYPQHIRARRTSTPLADGLYWLCGTIL
jgi:hypothetical protein